MATPPVFSAGAVLTASQMNAVGLWEITPTSVAGTGVTVSGGTVTLAAATTANINGVFTSDFDNYKIIISDVTTNAASSIYMRLRTTTDSTTTYNYAGIYRFYAAAGGADISGNNVGQWILCTPNATVAGLATMDVCSPNLAKPTTFQALCSNWDTTVLVGGNHQTSTAYSGFTVLSLTGNTITCKVRVYGYRN